MKALLIGEYNRVHQNLKNGLVELGHEATVVGFRDGFKKVNVDIELKHHFETGLLKKIRVLCIKLFNFDVLAFSLKSQIKKQKEQLSNYDIIQFVNEAPFLCDRKSQLKIIKHLLSQNKEAFLLSCGTDYPSVSFAYDKKFRYSILTPYFENKGSKKDFSPALSYLTPEHIQLHKDIFKTIKGVISNDLDYHIPLIGYQKYLGMIPHAIDLSALEYKAPIVNDKIIIFHGINTFNYYKKGNDIFEKALDIISKNYTDQIEIITAKNLPYKAYIKSFDRSHILLDQVYAYDQGFNALEAMAKGKVVFTGAEQEWLDYYNLKEDTAAINALPDAENIAKKLEWLIRNPEKIEEISSNARRFVETHHDHIRCAEQYLNTWKKHM